MQTPSVLSKQIWAALMIVAIALFVVADVQVLAGLTALLMAAVVMLDSARSYLRQRERRQRLAKPHNMTQAAEVAQAHAMHHPNFSAAYPLIDIGLLLDDYRRDGLYVRRVRSISKSDRALRPYVVLRSPIKGYAIPTLLRFEIIDTQGRPQYVYETEHPMHNGENAIVPNYRLPLKNNEKLGVAGEWMFNVWVDGGLIGSHVFTLYAAAQEVQASVDGEVPASEASEEAMPLSLEEVLAQQNSGTKV